jgi:hypothetical protein
MLLLFLFRYLPAYGYAVAFERFNPALGILKSQWVGWDNFVHLVKLPEFWQITTTRSYRYHRSHHPAVLRHCVRAIPERGRLALL